MLRVTQPFGDHAVGDDITDEAEIRAILASSQVAYVVVTGVVRIPPDLVVGGPSSSPEPAPADQSETPQE